MRKKIGTFTFNFSDKQTLTFYKLILCLQIINKIKSKQKEVSSPPDRSEPSQTTGEDLLHLLSSACSHYKCILWYFNELSLLFRYFWDVITIKLNQVSLNIILKAFYLIHFSFFPGGKTLAWRVMEMVNPDLFQEACESICSSSSNLDSSGTTGSWSD